MPKKLKFKGGSNGSSKSGSSKTGIIVIMLFLVFLFSIVLGVGAYFLLKEDDDESSSPPTPTPPSSGGENDNSNNKPFCTCNENCIISDTESKRINGVPGSCDVPPNIDDFYGKNGIPEWDTGLTESSSHQDYCNACYDLVNKKCRIQNDESNCKKTKSCHDPVLALDTWCNDMGGTRYTGTNILERCKGTSTSNDKGDRFVSHTINVRVNSGDWEGVPYVLAGPKVMINYLNRNKYGEYSTADNKYNPGDGPCTLNTNPLLKWDTCEVNNYPHCYHKY